VKKEIPISATGIVVIGRNEGERLRRCIASLAGAGAQVVYVDSDSCDGSSEFARAAGASVVQLDLSSPFTAARARNAGFDRLVEVAPEVELVQFIDGDCALRPGWLEAAVHALSARPDVAVVFGRREERRPEASVYNRLCHLEWDVPVGEVRSCGGDALIRASVFREVGGFDPGMIAGEEPDLCVRIARAGYRVLRIDADMSIHDAAMTRWTQWWKRAVRTGHTTAELLAKYGAAPEHARLRRGASAIWWALAVPVSALAAAAWAWSRNEVGLFALALAAPLVAYALLAVRIHRHCRRRGRTPIEARSYAVSCIAAKWPETWGMLLFAARRITRSPPRWIEYKDAPGAKA
jgi:GT2 family glycosyltransferase